MTHEQHLALDLIARLANRFGPASRIAKELPGWLEYLTEVECPERPRTRPSTQWWNKVRAIARDLVPAAGGGEGEIVQRNAALFGDHFGLSPVETSMLTFVALYKLFDGFEHVVDGALETKEVTVPLLLSWFCAAPEPEIRAAMRASGRLTGSGLLQRNRGGRQNRMPFALSDRLALALLAEVDSIADLIALMFPRAAAPQAEWQDFEGLGSDADLIRVRGPGARGTWKTIDVLACPVTFSPHPQQIDAARRGYDDWCHALGWVRDGLIEGGMLREVEVTAAMPKARPWQ